MKVPDLYPLKFQPQLKEKVWGGDSLRTRLGKKGAGTIGESWELSGVKDNVSIIANGIFEDKPLTELLELYGAELLGQRVAARFGTEFPLLFKFIDARQDLSVQLHPNDSVARKRHQSFGKTEMWYVVHAEKDAQLVLGFNRDIDKETYQNYLSKGEITKILHYEKVTPGDAFFIAPGTVHAIGAGVILAEIQQTSDITYRIYDWDRPGMDGNMRELHTELALDVIDFRRASAKLQFTEKENKAVAVCRSPYFVTHLLRLTENLQKDVSQIDSFKVYMCIAGEAQINSEPIKKGETMLLPACLGTVTIETEDVTLLEIYVP